MSDRVVSRLLQYDISTAEERFATVGALAERFFDEIEQRDISLFIEAGAKEATASQRARTELGLERVVAFEANPYTYRRFEDVLAAAGVDHRFLALTDRSGPVTFNVRLNAKGNPIADGQASILTKSTHAPGYERVQVDGVRLDDAVSDQPGRAAMWVDVEGANSQVFRGAPETLARTDVAIVEVEDRKAWDGQEWLHLDVVRHLAAAGLRPIARDQQSRYQFNVLFVRSE